MAATDSLDFSWMRRALYSAVVADVLDALGLREQVIDGELRLLCGGDVLVGLAKTTAWEEIDQLDPRPYALELRAVDECGADDVIVAAAGGSTRSGIWGELLSTAAARRGCAGVLVDGAVRDVAKMRELGFTVLARSANPRDSLHRQRVTAIDVDVCMGGVRIAPGDLIVADVDGAVVVPRAVVGETVERSREKVTTESRVRDDIRAGMSAVEVFRKHGVL